MDSLGSADSTVGKEEGSDQAEDRVGHCHGAVDRQVEGDVSVVTR